MGQQRKLKQFRRELKQFRRKNQRVRTTEMCGVVPTKESVSEKFDEIYEIVMPDFPFFSSINYELWATEMKKLTWLVDLLHYDQKGHVNFYDIEEVQ
jgi:hypothetical protein